MLVHEQRKLDAEKKAKLAEIKQLIEGNKLERKDAEKSYSFTYAKKVKKLYVTEEQQKLLSNSKLGIVTMGNDVFEVVPLEIWQKIHTREQNFAVKMTQQNSDDDEYADYEVPDDLDW